jgi:hypothetical protein
MAKQHPRPAARCSCFQKGIAHSGNCLHGIDRSANVGYGESVGAKVAKFSEFNQVLKTVRVARVDQARTLPCRNLLGTKAQNAKNVLTAISAHSVTLVEGTKPRLLTHLPIALARQVLHKCDFS